MIWLSNRLMTIRLKFRIIAVTTNCLIMKRLSILHLQRYFPFINDGDYLPEESVLEINFGANGCAIDPDIVESWKLFLKNFHGLHMETHQRIQNYILECLYRHYIVTQVDKEIYLIKRLKNTQAVLSKNRTDLSMVELLEIKFRFEEYLLEIEGLSSQQIYNRMYNTIYSEKDVISMFDTVTENWNAELKTSRFTCFIHDIIESVVDQVKLEIQTRM